MGRSLGVICAIWTASCTPRVVCLSVLCHVSIQRRGLEVRSFCLPSALNVNVKKSTQARVTGGSNYDSRKSRRLRPDVSSSRRSACGHGAPVWRPGDPAWVMVTACGAAHVIASPTPVVVPLLVGPLIRCVTTTPGAWGGYQPSLALPHLQLVAAEQIPDRPPAVPAELPRHLATRPARR